MLDAINARFGADPTAAEAPRVRSHLRSPLVGGGHDAPHLVGGPRRRVGLRSVEVELHEVGAVVELLQSQP
jgi:hypothetical protein